MTPANLFHFYRRYKWRAQDFQDHQDGMVDHTRGLAEGVVSAAVMDGMEATPGAALSVDIAAGFAIGPTGYLHVHDAVENVALTAPVGNPSRSLIVARPLLVDNTPITRPILPNDSVPLRQEQDSEIVLIAGTPAAQPAYPSTQANDVVLCGVRLAPGQTSVADVDLDFSVRDIPGKNTDLGQHQAVYDDRARPYRSTNQVLGIKPAQLTDGRGRAFYYVDRSTISKFPRDGSNMFAGGDSFYNFNTGAVSGGDAQTPAFFQQIPSAGNAIVATISLQTNDQVQIDYGTEGTRAQCLNAIINQLNAGAGGIAMPLNVARLAFVIIYSNDGLNVTEIDVIDARSTFNFGGSVQERQTVAFNSNAATGYTAQQNDRLILATMTGASGFTVTLGSAASYSVDTEITVKRLGTGTGTLTVQGTGGELVEGEASQTIDDERDTITLKPYNSQWYEV